jgi:regulator of replication initiation timing
LIDNIRSSEERAESLESELTKYKYQHESDISENDALKLRVEHLTEQLSSSNTLKFQIESRLYDISNSSTVN